MNSIVSSDSLRLPREYGLCPFDRSEVSDQNSHHSIYTVLRVFALSDQQENYVADISLNSGQVIYFQKK